MGSRKLEERLKQIESFIAEGLNREEIAERLGIKYPSFCVYLFHHQELPRPIRKKMRPRSLERYEQILEEGLSQSEIAEKLSISRQAVNDYFKHHPKLTKPNDKRFKFCKEKHNRLKNLLDKGLSQYEITKIMGVFPSTLNYYIRSHPELREIYDEQRGRK